MKTTLTYNQADILALITQDVVERGFKATSTVKLLITTPTDFRGEPGDPYIAGASIDVEEVFK